MGCFWLPGPCCFAGGLLSRKSSPNVLSVVEKQELVGKCLLGAGPSTPTEPARDLSTDTTSHDPLQIPCRELHSAKVDSYRGRHHSPNAPLLSNKTLAFFPLSLWSPQAKAGLGCLWLPGPCCFAGGLLSWKAIPNVFSFVVKQGFAGKCLLGAGPCNPPRAS